jgi:putative inorganic carbon (hco3(-)) transporter
MEWLQAHIEFRQSVLVRGWTSPLWHSHALLWSIAGVVAILLGLATLGISFLPMQWIPLCLVAVLCPFVAMIVGDVRRLLLVAVLIDIPFAQDVFIGYREELASHGAIGGWNISITTFAVVALCVFWLARLLAGIGPQPRPLLRAALPLAVYILCAALSIAVAYETDLVGFELFLLIQLFILYLYIVVAVRTPQDVLFVVGVLLAGLALEGAIMIGLRFVGAGTSIMGMTARVDPDGRVGGTIGSPNGAATYLTLLLAPAFSVLLIPVPRWYKWLAALAFALGGVALILTLSRGGWIAFILSMTILCFGAWRRGWLSLKLPLLGMLAAILLLIAFQDTLAARLFEDDRGSAAGRVPLMYLAFRIIADNPALGIGANNFALVMRQYLTLESDRWWVYIVHNNYLLIWAEKGLIGLISYLGFLAATLHRTWRRVRAHDPMLSPLALGFLGALIGHFVHMNLDVFNGRTQIQLLWLIAGLLTAMQLIDTSAASSSRMNRLAETVAEY